MVKKILIVVILLVLVAAGVVAYLVMQRPASLQDWLGRQVVGIANAYLVPRLDYKTVRYNAPLEVVLTDVTLTAPDGTRVVDVGGMTITLAETPSYGQSIKIKRLLLSKGSVNLVKNTGAEGGFKGLSPIVRGGTAKKDDVPNEFRLSNVMRLDLIQLDDCSIRYEQGSGAAPMVLGGITTKLDIVPAGEPGWYTLNLNAGRAPAAVIQMQGKFNADTFTADIQQGTIVTKLDPASAQTLPPDIQQLLKTYDMAGTLNATVSGKLPLTEFAKGDLTVNANVADFSFAAGGYRLPMQRLTTTVRVANGSLELPDLQASLLSGSLSASVKMDMTKPERPTQATWNASNLDLAQLQRDPRAAQDPKKIVGKLASTGSASLQAGKWPQGVSGSGKLTVREGRLFALPGFMDIVGMVDKALSGRVGAVNNHEAEADFTLKPEGIDLTRCEIKTDLMAARATGLVGFDKRLDLAVNAGPMEKLQSLFGKIGSIIGTVTDKLATYRVKGTTDEPKVSLEILGQ